MTKLVKFIFIVVFSAMVISCIPQRSPTPTISPMMLLVWANEAAVTAYSYNFANYQNQLQNASKYFTLQGWQYYESTLNLNQVVNQKLIVSAVASGSPLILQQGAHQGKHNWTVQMPLLVTYENATTREKQNLIITMRIVTASSGIRGLAIEQFSAIPRT